MTVFRCSAGKAATFRAPIVFTLLHAALCMITVTLQSGLPYCGILELYTTAERKLYCLYSDRKRL